MTFSNLLTKANLYLKQGQNFAIVQVIDRESPSSGKIGDKALILETGDLIGWIGGGCVRGIAIKEALEVIKTKQYKKVRISPRGSDLINSKHFKNYTMSCQSGGTVELLIEPSLPLPHLIIVGKSNIARKLVQVALAIDFKVSVMAPNTDKQMFPEISNIRDEINFSSIPTFINTYIIVTTQDENDEESVKKALLTPAKYVGLVASRKKQEKIKKYLVDQGMREKSEQLISPVGVDINAKTGGEVAISILTQIIKDFRKKESKTTSKISTPIVETSTNNEEFYINPVCNVPVSKQNPKHILDYEGQKVYFCCDGCRVSFEKDPSLYLS